MSLLDTAVGKLMFHGSGLGTAVEKLTVLRSLMGTAGHFFWLAGPRGCAVVHCCALAGEESTMAPKGRKRKAKEPEAKAVNSEDVKPNGGANTLPKRLRGEGSRGPGPRVVIEHCKS
ncbi:unnamed protein product [Caretta caretta]